MHRTANRRIDPTPQRGRVRWAWLAAALCAVASRPAAAAAASSGFDLALQRENMAIDTALIDRSAR